MKSRILTISLILFSFPLFGQKWIAELEKQQNKPVIEIIKSMDSYFNTVGATRENKYHHYIRWQQNAINHINKDGKLFNYASKNRAQLRIMEKQISENKVDSDRYFHGNWTSVNPNNFQNPANDHPNMGRITCVVKPPSNSNIIYVGSAGGGIWKTYNHGATWIPLWDGMSQMGVSDILIDVNYENHLIAMTGTANAKYLPTSGIIESWDGGQTWNMIYDVDMDQVEYGYKMVQNIFNTTEYYFGLDNIPGTDFKKLTTTGTPNVVSGGSVFGSVFDMEYAMGSDTTLFIASAGGVYKKSGLNSVIKLPSTSNLPTTTCSRSAIAVAPSDPNYIYYLHAISEDNYSVHRSTNGGDTFQQMFIDTTEGGTKLIEQVTINLNLAVDPSNKNKVYIGSVNHSSSTNGGTNWSLDNEGLHADAHDIYFSHGNQYLCTDGGLSYRPIGTTNWIDINNGLLITQFYKMDISGSKIVGGTQDNGTLFWNEGDNLGIRKVGADGFDCLYNYNNDDNVFTTTQEELNRSMDNGDTYSVVLPHRWAAPISFWPNDTDKVITFDKEVLRVSYDNGITWPDSLNILPDAYLYSGFSQCTNSPEVAYACGDHQVVRSTNFNNPSTSNWQDITNGIDTEFSIFRNILVHPDSSDVVFVVKAGYNDTQIYKSTNGGDEWDPYNQGIPDIPVYCIYYDHVNGNGYYLGTELGVYYRNNTMQEWIPFATYLPRVQVMDLKITNTYIYAATFGRGIWKSELYKSCPVSAGLYQSNDPTNGKPSGHQIHKFSVSMTANRIIQGGEGTDVLYQAGNYIDLIPGFHARQYNLFTAKAAGCLE